VAPRGAPGRARPRGEHDTGVVFFLTLEILFFSLYDPLILQFFPVRFELTPRTHGKCGSTTCPGTSSTPGRARARGGVSGCWSSLTLELSFFHDKTLWFWRVHPRVELSRRPVMRWAPWRARHRVGFLVAKISLFSRWDPILHHFFPLFSNSPTGDVGQVVPHGAPGRARPREELDTGVVFFLKTL
jgi:hypothetical protein